MNRLFKNTLWIIAFLSLIMFFATDALASHNTAENTGNGAGSFNSAVSTSFESIVVDMKNINETENNVSTIANSGSNTAKENVDGGEIRTGSADSSTSIKNGGSTNSVSLECNCDSQKNTAANKNNGSDSVNIAAADSVKLKTFLLENINRIKNRTNTNALSGENYANKNVDGGDISTGDAKAETEIVNPSSENIVESSSAGGAEDVNSAENIGNGTQSLNSATATSFESLLIDLRNRNRERNNTSTQADSGGNRSNKNVGGGEIETGNASSTTDILGSSLLNSIELLCASCNAQLNRVKNAHNGADSVNIGSSNSTLIKNALFDNVNRSRNKALTFAKTGNNKANENIGGGMVRTGNGNASTSIGSSNVSNISSL